MSPSSKSLAPMRREIDEIDDSIHDLIMRRAEIVENIGRAKRAGDAPRPDREAVILRRLLSRHQGSFPRKALVRIWCEMMGAFIGMQGPFSLAVYAPDREAGYHDLARRQFGAVVPVADFRSAGEVVAAVGRGDATLGVLPVPMSGEPDPWWRNLVVGEGTPPRIVGRLPMAAMGDGNHELEAMAVGRLEPEETGEDGSFMVLETATELSRARLTSALADARLEPLFIDTRRERDDLWLILVEVAGYLGEADGRVERLVMDGRLAIERAHRVGGYAVPARGAGDG